MKKVSFSLTFTHFLLKVEGGESDKVPIGKWISIKIFFKFINL